MKILLISILCLTTFTSIAGVNTIYKKNKRIYLEADSCSGVELKGRTVSHNPCKMDITNSVHPFIRKKAGKKAFWEGPNCWNATMIVQGLRKRAMYMIGSEVEHIVEKSSSCKEITKFELKMNDVIYIYYPGIPAEDGVRAEHSFTYLGDGWGFTKNGFKSNKKYKFQKVKDVVENEYGVGKNRRKVKYFRCKKRYNFHTLAGQLLKSKLEKIEKKLYPQVFYGTKVYTREELTRLKKELEALYKDLNENRAKTNRELYRLKFRVKSLSHQIRFIVSPTFGIPGLYM